MFQLTLFSLHTNNMLWLPRNFSEENGKDYFKSYNLQFMEVIKFNLMFHQSDKPKKQSKMTTTQRLGRH